jgi:glyoxylase-like metal-dependent hydrolase (beta-lactamase superfamily II)
VHLKLIAELDLKLVKAVDTHLHADHITGLGALRDRTHCITVMGEQSGVDVVSMRVTEGDRLDIEGLSLDVLYTPGHTDDSYSFLLSDRVFTGDTLLSAVPAARISRTAVRARNTSRSSESS